MKLYLRDKDGTLKRSENFPMTSLVVGNYVANIFYVPDAEFQLAMDELGIERTKLNAEGLITNNEVIPLYCESGKIDCFLRPDKHREKDRADFQGHKELKARGIITDLRKN